MRRFDATTLSNVILPTLLVASFGLFMTAVVHRISTDGRENDVREVSARAADAVGRTFNPALAVVHGIHAFWLGSEMVTKEEFDAYAKELHGYFPEILALEWVDAGNVVRFVYPADGVNAAAIDFDNNPFPSRLQPILDAKESRATVMTRPVFLAQGFPGVVLYDPIFRDDEYLGAAVVVVRLEDMLGRLRVSLIAKDHDLIIESDGVLMRPEYDAIFIDGKRVIAPDGSGVPDEHAPRWPEDASARLSGTIVAGRLWNVVATPKRSGEPVATALAIITVGMTALCGIFFATVRKARRQLEKTIARERDFTSLVSHQLRAPLTELNWMADVLAEPDTDAETRATTLGDMRTIVRQGVRTVNSLLSISRIERGVMQIRREDLPVATIVDDALAALREQARAKGITFNIDVPAEHSVHVDHTQAVEALRNIIDNALKYGPERRPVTITSRKDGSFVVIDVADHGKGVPEDVRDKLFDKATILTRKDGSEGAGLGLYLSKMLIELMGGTVTLRSKPGDTVFSLRLPDGSTAQRSET